MTSMAVCLAPRKTTRLLAKDDTDGESKDISKNRFQVKITMSLLHRKGPEEHACSGSNGVPPPASSLQLLWTFAERIV